MPRIPSVALALAAIALTLGVSAHAQPGGHPSPGGVAGQGHPQLHPRASAPADRAIAPPQRAQPPRVAVAPQPPRAALPHKITPTTQRQWQRGQQLPPQWRQPVHVEQNWKRRGLPQPARGQQWVRHGADHLLVSVATGVISQLVLGR